MNVAPYPAHAYGPDDGRRWYVVQAQPRREELAVRHLRNQQFDVFCPLRRQTKRVGRHTKNVLAPFFPAYLFVRLALERDRWRSINGTVGVLRLVSFGPGSSGCPAAMPKGLVEQFQRMSAAGEGDLRFDDPLKPGDEVRIMGGPFEQLCGTFERARDHERVTVLLQILSSEIKVHLSRDTLIAA